MNLQEIVDAARYRFNNYEKPYLHIDSEMAFYANNSINQFCREAYALIDSSTASVCEIPLVANTMDYALAASVIFVHGAKIVTQELMTLDVAPATVWSASDTITGALSTKTCNIIEYLTTTTYVVDQRTGTFTLGESLSNGTVAADQGATYPTFIDYQSSEIALSTRQEMDRLFSGWRTVTSAQPTKFILDFTTGYITVYPKPDKAYTLRLSVSRYPITAMSATAMSVQTPELDSKYHNDIVNGIVAQMYLKRGDNTFDQKQAAIFDGLFKSAISKAKIQNYRHRLPETISEPHGAFI